MMEEKVLRTIKDNRLIQDKDNVVVGVSGGPDSMALLYLLLHAQKHIDFNILVAHVNHGVRGEEADADELFVKRKAQELGLPFFSTRVDMEAYGDRHKISHEEAGRKLRYGFFRNILKSYQGGKIAVAHNMNDQAETLLMRIMRGTGIDGLSGMKFKSGDIIRPILNITRQEIEAYIEDNKIETVLDRTNLIPIYTRNKVRLELIPYIEDNFNPNIIETLWRLSQTSQTDSEFLRKYTEERYSEIVKSEGTRQLVLDAAGFKDLALGIQQRIIIFALTRLLGQYKGFGEQHISAVAELFRTASTGKVLHLPNNIRARVTYDSLIVEVFEEEAKKPFVYDLTMGYNYPCGLNYSFYTRIVDIDEISLNDKLPNIKYFDYDRIKGKLSVRNRRAGDRFAPYGMEGSKKLKDFFIDLKVPREERDRIPLIVDEENIIWVVGYRISDLHKVTKKTKKVLMIEYRRLDGEDNHER